MLKYLQWKFTPPVPHFWANTFTSLLHHKNTDPPEHSEEVSKVLKIADRFGSRLAFTDYVACNDQSKQRVHILLPPTSRLRSNWFDFPCSFSCKFCSLVKTKLADAAPAEQKGRLTPPKVSTRDQLPRPEVSCNRKPLFYSDLPIFGRV